MDNKIKALKKAEIIWRLILATCFSLLVFLVCLADFFLLFNRPDREVNPQVNILFLIWIGVFLVMFLVLAILNVFVIKNKRLDVILSSIQSGGFVFCIIALVVTSIASIDKLSFNKDYISIFISSSLTLLGFGLAITAILSPFFAKRIKNDKNEKQIEMVFVYMLPYFLSFTFGLIYTIWSLIEIQFIEKGYYQIIVYKALIYSSWQILMIVYRVGKEIVLYVLDENKTEKSS